MDSEFECWVCEPPLCRTKHAFLKAVFNLPEEVLGFKRLKKTDNGMLASELWSKFFPPPDWWTDLTGSGTVGTVWWSVTDLAAVEAVDVTVGAVNVAVGEVDVVFNLFEAEWLLWTVPKGFLKIWQSRVTSLILELCCRELVVLRDLDPDCKAWDFGCVADGTGLSRLEELWGRDLAAGTASEVFSVADSSRLGTLE